MKNSDDVAALILNYNGMNIIDKTITSLLNQSLVPHIVMIDNASEDNSVEYVRKNYPMVEIIENDKNYDFGTAYNRAIESRSEKYIFIVNNDIEVEKDGIKNAYEYLEKNDDVAAVSFIVFEMNEKIQYPYDRDYILKKRFGIDLGTHVIFESRDSGAHDMRYLWGGACMIRRMIFERVKFDEDFSWYWEDADLGWSIVNVTGFRCVALSNAIVRHMGGVSTKKRFGMSKATIMDHRNAILSFAKNATLKELIIATPQMLYFFILQKEKVSLLKNILKKLKYERNV